MRIVEVSRRIDALPDAVRDRLAPGRLIEYEGSFVVVEETETDDGWEVVARGSGTVVTFAFERLEDGYAWRAVGDVGPFETLESELTLSPAGTGTEVEMRSSVSVRLPLPFADRFAAAKRRSELERALDGLAADVE